MEARVRMNEYQKTQLSIGRVNAYNLYKQRKAAEKVARAAEEQESYVDPRTNLMNKWQYRLQEQELLSQMTAEEQAEYMAEQREIAEQEAWDNSAAAWILGTIGAIFKALFTIVLALFGLFVLLVILGVIASNISV